MKKVTAIFMMLLMLFFLFSTLELPIIPKTVDTVSAERVDTLKVIEELPHTVALSQYDVISRSDLSDIPDNWHSYYSQAISGFPAGTFKDADNKWAIFDYYGFELDCIYRDPSVVYFTHMWHYFYFKAKFSGQFNSTVIYDDSIRVYLYFKNSTTGDKTYSYIFTSANFSISSSALDSDGRAIIMLHVYLKDDPSLTWIVRIGYFDVSQETEVWMKTVSKSIPSGYDLLTEVKIFIDFMEYAPDPVTLYVTADHEAREEDILHHIEVPGYAYGASITVYKPSEWSFYNITPSATVTEYSDRIEITDTIEGDYDIYFTSTDFWNYPRQYQTRISYFDQRGNYIPFESFFTYYNLSWTELASPSYVPLYSDLFTMDPAQYLSIQVYDRWSVLLLEEKNLTYQEFYNFTINLYSFKLISFQDDFVHMKLKRAEATEWYTEWIAPGEIEEEHLGTGWYNLTIQFKNGTEVSLDFYMDTDITYIVQGWTLTKLAGHLDISFAHFIGISIKNNYTGDALPISYFIIKINETEKSLTSNELLYIEEDIANITILDSFRQVLNQKLVNVTETGWVNIGVNVTHLVLRNPYEIYGINMTITATTTGVTRTFLIPPLESIDTFINAATYNYTVKLMDPEMKVTLREVSGQFEIKKGQIEYIILFGWNIFPDVYMDVKFFSETGTVNLVCEITIYMNYSKLAVPDVYLEIYVDDELSGTGITDSHGKAIIGLVNPLNGTGTLSIKASKLGVSRWYNTTFQIWGWITVEEPPYIVQGETATYNIILSNPSRIGDTPIKIEDAIIVFNVYNPNLTTLIATLNKSTIDIPPGSSQFTFALNTTDLEEGGYVLEVKVIYMNSTFAIDYVAFTVTPRPTYRIVVPWWLIIAIVLIALATFFVAWFILYLVRRVGEVKQLYQSNIKHRPSTIEKILPHKIFRRKPPPK